MFDIHMHILPGLDDGAKTMADSVAMALMAFESGVKGVAATSHGNTKGLTRAAYEQAFAKLKAELEKEKIPLKLYPGMEIFMDHDVMDKLAAGELLTLNQSRYVLAEFDFGEELWMVNDYLQMLRDAGYLPVIAHAERYAFVQKNPEAVYDWAGQGYVIQVNKGSLLGGFGRRERETAISLLEHKLIHVISSDAHGIRERTPSMHNISRFLGDCVSPKYKELLLHENPRRILAGEEVLAFVPKPYRRNYIGRR